MNTDKALLMHKDVTDRVLAAFFAVYNTLGHGFLESVYESALAIAMTEAGLHVERQVPISVHFRGHNVGEYRVDLTVERQVIVEVKALSTLVTAQATKLPVGLLLNFGPRPQFKRRVFTESCIRVDPRQSVAMHDV